MKRASSRHRFLAFVGLVAIAAFLCVGCDDGSLICTTDVVPGISIKVVDAESNLPAACGTTAWILSDSYSEELTGGISCDLPDSLQYAWIHGAHERSGTYSVLLLKEGYAPWSRIGIVVRGGACHVEEVKLEARLIRIDG